MQSIKAATKYANLAWVYQQINREKAVMKIKALALAVSILTTLGWYRHRLPYLADCLLRGNPF